MYVLTLESNDLYFLSNYEPHPTEVNDQNGCMSCLIMHTAHEIHTMQWEDTKILFLKCRKWERNYRDIQRLAKFPSNAACVATARQY